MIVEAMPDYMNIQMENCTLNNDENTEEQIKMEIMDKLVRIWQDRWDNSVKGRITYWFIPKVDFVHNSAEWFNPGLSASFLLTGHGSIRSKLVELGIEAEDACVCGSEETWRHIMFECRIYEECRRNLKIKINNDNIDNVQKLISDKRNYAAFVEFANDVFKLRSSRVQLM